MFCRHTSECLGASGVCVRVLVCTSASRTTYSDSDGVTTTTRGLEFGVYRRPLSRRTVRNPTSVPSPGTLMWGSGWSPDTLSPVFEVGVPTHSRPSCPLQSSSRVDCSYRVHRNRGRTPEATDSSLVDRQLPSPLGGTTFGTSGRGQGRTPGRPEPFQ